MKRIVKQAIDAEMERIFSLSDEELLEGERLADIEWERLRKLGERAIRIAQGKRLAQLLDIGQLKCS